MILIAACFHIILPLMLLYWTLKSRKSYRFDRLLILFFTGAFLLFLHQAGAAWSMLSIWWPTFYLIAFLLVAIFVITKSKNKKWFAPRRLKLWLKTIIMIGLVVVILPPLMSLSDSRSFNEKPIELLFPLCSGRYHVGHGGSSVVLNHHHEIAAQKYALDITKLNHWGMRASGILPSELSDYEIFEDDLMAPCSGEVIYIENNLIDNIPPQTDRENLVGNSVVIFCEGYSVLLAHLKNKSILLKENEKVIKGDLIGKVGNSGNTSEPHLHIHAVKGRVSSVTKLVNTGEGVPMTFNETFLIRNDRVDCRK